MKHKIAFFALGGMCAVLLAGILLVPQGARAGSEHNIEGWAWSDNIGWISFNCTNSVPGNPEGTCGAVNYGVHADFTSGNFSGYAWSDSIGWIKFDPAGPYPEGPAYSSCVDSPGPGQICDGIGDNAVSGWARACAGAANADCTGPAHPDAGGWDGWIKLRDDAFSYGVSFIPSTRTFTGWAWGGTEVVGWISFDGITGDGDPYEVILGNTPPTASPLGETTFACVNPPAVRMQWTYSDPEGDPQDAYQVQLKEGSNDFSSPDFDTCPGTCDPGNISQEYTAQGGTLGYGLTYYWRVRVWDDRDEESLWAEAAPFTTVAHAYPKPNNFDWLPKPTLAEELTQFSDAGDFADPMSNTADAFDPAAAGKVWLWEFGDGDTSGQEDPVHVYTDTTEYTVRLTVQDDVGSCFAEKQLKLLPPFPIWKEITPFSPAEVE